MLNTDVSKKSAYMVFGASILLLLLLWVWQKWQGVHTMFTEYGSPLLAIMFAMEVAGVALNKSSVNSSFKRGLFGASFYFQGCWAIALWTGPGKLHELAMLTTVMAFPLLYLGAYIASSKNCLKWACINYLGMLAHAGLHLSYGARLSAVDTQLLTAMGLSGPFYGLYLSFMQKSTQKAALLLNVHDSLLKKAETDELTGVSSRNALTTYKFSIKDYSQIAVLMIDADLFKQINDKHGHLKGDQVLKGLATILKNSVRDSDLLIRWGGEEFVIIAHTPTLEDALSLGERVRHAVYNQSPDYCGHPVTVSVGIGWLASDSTTLEQLIDCADVGVYAAKKKGRNRVEQGYLTSCLSCDTIEELSFREKEDATV